MTDHISVLLQEAIDALQVQADAWYIDGTFGRGGHTAEILRQGGKVIAFDVDAQAIQFGQEKFANEIAEQRLLLIRENFEKLEESIHKLTSEEKMQIAEISGALFDFGTSTNQLMDKERGFSFDSDAQLDMRMDDRLGVKAKDLLALLPERQMAQLFIDYGGEHEARRIAKAIVETRERHSIQTVNELLEVIEKAKKERRGHLHPATKVFQALRIVVNSEIDSIQNVLPQAIKILKPGGRIVTISFHEGEDRLVKEAFRQWENRGLGINITKNVVVASDEELAHNPRARSAKLRIFEKNKNI